MSVTISAKSRKELEALVKNFTGKVTKISCRNRKLPRNLQYTPGTVGGRERGVIVRANPLRG